MIELDEFDIPHREHAKLVFRQALMSGILPLACLVAYMISLTIVGMWVLSLFTLFGTIVAVCLICITLYHAHALSQKHAHLYQKRNISFDADKFHIHAADGSEVHVLLNHILRADRFGDYYRLFFLNAGTCFFIPVSSFRSEEDRVRFETEILGSKMKVSHRINFWYNVCMLLFVCLFGFTLALIMASSYGYNWIHILKVAFTYWMSF
jgi:hypothetical protein